MGLATPCAETEELATQHKDESVTLIKVDLSFLIVVFSLGLLFFRRLRLKAERLDINLLFFIHHLKMKVGRLSINLG